MLAQATRVRAHNERFSGRVARKIDRHITATAHQLELIGLLGSVPAEDGRLVIGAPLATSGRDDIRRYRAVLRFRGFLPITHELELEVSHLGGGQSHLSARSAALLSRRLAKARYEAALERGLASIERLLPWQEATETALAESDAARAAASDLAKHSERAFTQPPTGPTPVVSLA